MPAFSFLFPVSAIYLNEWTKRELNRKRQPTKELRHPVFRVLLTCSGKGIIQRAEPGGAPPPSWATRARPAESARAQLVGAPPERRPPNRNPGPAPVIGP